MHMQMKVSPLEKVPPPPEKKIKNSGNKYNSRGLKMLLNSLKNHQQLFTYM